MKKTLTSLLATIPLIAGSCSKGLDQETPEMIALNNYGNLVENYFEAKNGNLNMDKDLKKFLKDYKPSEATEVEKILIESAFKIEDNNYKIDNNIKTLDGMYNTLDSTRKIALYETFKELK
jgi:hypothetical protein